MVKTFSIVFNVYQDDGQYISECWSLPGVTSCGSTEEKALDNGWDALANSILVYLSEGREIPWVAEAWTGAASTKRYVVRCLDCLMFGTPKPPDTDCGNCGSKNTEKWINPNG